MAIWEDINTLGDFCGVRDVPELSPAAMMAAAGTEQADVMALFGGSILCGGDVLAEAMLRGAARHIIIVGGEGHTTQALRDTVHGYFPEIPTEGRPEAEIFNEYLYRRYGLRSDLLETASTNCGNNITNMLQAIRSAGWPCRSIILCQDATMQRRMDATLRKHAPQIRIVNYAAYRAEVLPDLSFNAPPLGMWPLDRYVALLMGEIPRLSEEGYGPRGAAFIAHVDIPENVLCAHDRLKSHLNGRDPWNRRIPENTPKP